jgi:UDP-N-acetylmuramyl pentapeptide phosphotransferase/UDP-N-acetylglucosamine-1-phosphate transferase
VEIMNLIAIRLIVFACVFGGALFGMFLRRVLPEEHLSADSKDTVRIGMNLTGTLTALVLGLLVASAKSYYDTQSSELTEMSANFVLLDRVLAHYGPETKEDRDLLRDAIVRVLEELWPKDSAQHSPVLPTAAGGEIIYDKIQELSPKNDAQRSLQAQALNLGIEIGKMRWTMFEQAGSFVSMPLLAVLVFWLTAIFTSFGLFAPRNATALVTYSSARYRFQVRFS